MQTGVKEDGGRKREWRTETKLVKVCGRKEGIEVVVSGCKREGESEFSRGDKSEML